MLGKKKKQQEEGEWIYTKTKDWTCPACGKKHTKPHFAFTDQIDYTKEPEEKGRIKFNREGKESCNGNYLDDTAKVSEKDISAKNQDRDTGMDTEERTGRPRPLFCGHCGWEDELLYIVKTKHKEQWK